MDGNLGMVTEYGLERRDAIAYRLPSSLATPLRSNHALVAKCKGPWFPILGESDCRSSKSSGIEHMNHR